MIALWRALVTPSLRRSSPSRPSHNHQTSTLNQSLLSSYRLLPTSRFNTNLHWLDNTNAFSGFFPLSAITTRRDKQSFQLYRTPLAGFHNLSAETTSAVACKFIPPHRHSQGPGLQSITLNRSTTVSSYPAPSLLPPLHGFLPKITGSSHCLTTSTYIEPDLGFLRPLAASSWFPSWVLVKPWSFNPAPECFLQFQVSPINCDNSSPDLFFLRGIWLSCPGLLLPLSGFVALVEFFCSWSWYLRRCGARPPWILCLLIITSNWKSRCSGLLVLLRAVLPVTRHQHSISNNCLKSTGVQKL